MTTRPERIENAVQIIILLAIGGMAGAASFTHVHDWTMHNTPAGTGGWFGWANAVISELTPTAAGLEIRRRKRHNRPIAYPMTVLIAAAALSLSAQVAEAKPSLTGWLLSAVPALAFLALSKLVLSRTTTHPEGNPSLTTAETLTEDNPGPDPAADSPEHALAVDIEASAAEELPPQLVTSARMAAFAHHQSTGQPITTEALATHLEIPSTLAGTLLRALDGIGIPGTRPSIVTTIDGTPVTGSRL